MSEQLRCECSDDARRNPNPAHMYEEEELKAYRHPPNECPGDYGLARYRRPDGTVKTLCSCCNRTGDVLLNELKVDEPIVLDARGGVD